MRHLAEYEEKEGITLMQSHLFGLIRAMLLMLLSVAPAQAVVIVEKPPNGILSSTFGAGYSNVGLNQERIADDFVLATTSAQVNTITWYGWFPFPANSTTTGDFDILFYNDLSGVPAATPFYTTTVTNATGIDTGLNAEINDILQWTASVPTATFAGPGNYPFKHMEDPQTVRYRCGNGQEQIRSLERMS